MNGGGEGGLSSEDSPGTRDGSPGPVDGVSPVHLGFSLVVLARFGGFEARERLHTRPCHQRCLVEPRELEFKYSINIDLSNDTVTGRSTAIDTKQSGTDGLLDAQWSFSCL